MLRQEILSGRTTRERKLAVCAAGAGLSPEDRAEALAVLAGDTDEMIAQRAASSLLNVPLDAVIAALKRPDAAPGLFHYCSQNMADAAGVADTMADNPACPADALVEVAPYLTTAVEALVEDLDRLTATPGLVTALAPCKSLTTAQRAALEELQKDGAGDTAYSDAAAAADIESAPEAERAVRLSMFQRVAKMRVTERVQLALKGSREERMLLVRDANKMVQRAVMLSPRLTDQEVESFAAMSSLNEDILRLIAKKRQFIKNYVVVKNLVTNPKTPLDVSLHLLPRINAKDLKFLTKNKNVPETLRTMAVKLERQRATAKPGSGE